MTEIPVEKIQEIILLLEAVADERAEKYDAADLWVTAADEMTEYLKEKIG
jgi:hypothetical protein